MFILLDLAIAKRSPSFALYYPVDVIADERSLFFSANFNVELVSRRDFKTPKSIP